MDEVRVYAWADGCSAPEVLTMLQRFSGKLGAVLYRRSFAAAYEPGSFIAFCGGIDDVKSVVALVQNGAKFRAVILMDELNLTSTFSSYAAEAIAAKKLLDGVGIPFWGMSTHGMLAPSTPPDYTWLREEASQLRVPVLCWNASGTRSSILGGIGTIKMPRFLWFLSPHPWRFTLWPPFDSGWMNWLLDHLHGRTAYWYASKVARLPNVAGVGLWCLRSYGHGHFGLFTKGGKLTGIGRGVKRALDEWDRRRQ